ncbi:MAG: hypothetical protein U0835_10550 [Isosphaeraceae bacterium]
MSDIQPVSEGESHSVPAVAQPKGPYKNPSYPQRIHVHERAHWNDVLKSCEERVALASRKLAGLGASADRSKFDRLYAQMEGARDQVADAARRLPVEAGALYHEDLERIEQALAAMERVWKSWESLSA